MKTLTFGAIFLLILTLIACAPVGTFVPTATITPTKAPTITPTLVTYLPGLSTDVPEPDTAFVEYVVNENYQSVMGLTRDQVVLSYKEHTGIDGQPYVVMVDDSTGVPLAVYFEGEWRKATLKFFGKQNGIVMGTDTVEAYTLTDMQIMSSFERATIAVGNFWDSDEPEFGQINLDEAAKAQKLENALTKNGVTEIVAHCVIGPSSFPEWLKNGNFTKDELRTIMQGRIQYVIDQNPIANFLVVINEPWQADTPSQEYDVFYKAWGNSYDYITEAFQFTQEYAKATNRNIKLIFNDTDNHRKDGGMTNSTRTIVKTLHENGLIDYVGMQMHLNQWCGVQDGVVDKDTILEQIEYYRSLGVPVLFTEVTYEPTEAELTMDEKAFNSRLAQIFGQVFQIAIKSDNVYGITFWGVTDKYIKDINWYQIFDEIGQPKQSYYVVLRTLYEGIK